MLTHFKERLNIQTRTAIKRKVLYFLIVHSWIKNSHYVSIHYDANVFVNQDGQ